MNITKLDPIAQIPEEMSFQIFSDLNINDLASACQVNKEWRRMASDNCLWKPFFSTITIPANENIKEWLAEHAVKSRDEILQKVKKFASDVSLSKRGFFNCLFPFNPEYVVTAELGSGKFDPQSEPDVRKICIFVKKMPDDQENLYNTWKRHNERGEQASCMGPGSDCSHIREVQSRSFITRTGFFSESTIVMQNEPEVKDLSDRVSGILQDRITELKIQAQTKKCIVS